MIVAAGIAVDVRLALGVLLFSHVLALMVGAALSITIALRCCPVALLGRRYAALLSVRLSRRSTERPVHSRLSRLSHTSHESDLSSRSTRESVDEPLLGREGTSQ